VKVRMVTPGIIGDHDHPASGPTAGLAQLAKKRPCARASCRRPPGAGLRNHALIRWILMRRLSLSPCVRE
jgi:hypothetical protein